MTPRKPQALHHPTMMRRISAVAITSPEIPVPTPSMSRRTPSPSIHGIVTAALTFRVALGAMGCMLLAAFSPAAMAAEERRIPFDIPETSAVQVLRMFSAQSGRQILYANDELGGITTNAVRGEFTAADALSRLLAGTPLVATPDQSNGAVAVGRERNVPNDRRAALATADGRPLDRGQPGAIQGRVSNLATGAYLEGAQITLSPGNISALTARDPNAGTIFAKRHTMTARLTPLAARKPPKMAKSTMPKKSVTSNRQTRMALS